MLKNIIVIMVWLQMATAYCLFAYIYENSYDTSVENLELALNHLKKAGYKSEQYDVYYQLAHLSSHHNKPEDILKYTKKMVELKKDSLTLQVADHLNLEAYCKLGDKVNAKKCFERVKRDMDNNKISIGALNSALSGLIAYQIIYGNPDEIPELISHIGEGNETLKLQSEIDYNNAKHNYKKSYDALWDLYQLEKQKLINIQENEVATLNTIFKTNELKEEKQQLEIEKAESRNQRNLILIFALVLLLVAAAYFIYSTRKHNKRLKIERDNTEEQRKIAEEQRHIAEEERNNAVRLNELKTEFLNSMSHEMRTPLNSIIGFNDMLNNSNITLSQEKRQEMMGHINFHSQQLMHLLDHVVILSRIDCNDAKPVPEDVDIKQILESLYYENEDRIPAGVEFDMSSIMDSVWVKTDKEFVTIILRELIDNAIKFTSHGSITFTAVQNEYGARVTIKDTGCGLPKENLDQIYNRFEKFTSFEAGFGLGMSCCKELVDIIQSKITIDTSYIDGACFIVDFKNI